MRRTAFDDRQDRQVVNEIQANSMSCPGCGTFTPNEDLSNYGHRCGACFDAFCRAAGTGPIPKTRNEKRAILDRLKAAAGAKPSRAWAWSLRQREFEGVRLGRVQKEAWRAALSLDLADEQEES